MSATPKRKLTAADYLAIERDAPYKSEFYNGEMFAMSGASPAHNRVKDNLIGLLAAQLRGTGCYTHSSDQRVRVDATGLYTYPDVVILCGPGEYAPEDAHTLLNPKVVIEVLSDSTRRYDRGAKLGHYQAIPSVEEYVLVEQDEPVVEHYVRPTAGRWEFDRIVGLDAEFAFAAVTARVRLSDVYDGVTFPDPPPR
jgi:Uma2 family endonuclease